MNDEEDDAQLLDNAAIASDDVDIIIRSNNESATQQINVAGNNILNSNISGSFREENEIAVSNGRVIPPRSHSSAPNILLRTDEEEPSTSSSTISPRRLGVAAIPNSNIQFLSSQRHHDSISRE